MDKVKESPVKKNHQELQEIKLGFLQTNLKSCSFEEQTSRETERNKEQKATKFNLNFDTRSKLYQENKYEVILSVTVTTQRDDKSLYIVKTEQLGLFLIQDASPKQLDHLLNIYCPSVLYPYVRQTVSNLISSAGYSPLLLPPINFESLQELQQHKQKDSATMGNKNEKE